MPEELRKSFHAQLSDVHDDIVRLAAMVCEALPRGTQALLDLDLVEAQRLIESDDMLDELALSIEERCYRLLALQQPMAGDMRAIVAALKLVDEYERSGDLVVNICKALRRMYGVSLDPTLRGLISQMSDEALRLTRMSIEAYSEGNEGLAAALDDIDDRLDDLQGEFIEAVFNAPRPVDPKEAVQLALIARYYERIGDHAVNVGERVRYMVTGWMPEHTGAARAAARRLSESSERSDQAEPGLALDDAG